MAYAASRIQASYGIVKRVLSEVLVALYMYILCIYLCMDKYCSLPSKHPWTLNHNLLYLPGWALTREENYIYIVVFSLIP